MAGVFSDQDPPKPDGVHVLEPQEPPRTVMQMARRVYDLTNELNAAFDRLSAEVRRRRAAGISDARTCRELDRAADTPERKKAQEQIERVLMKP